MQMRTSERRVRIAGHRDSGAAHAGIGLDEGLLDLVRRDVQRASSARDIPAGSSPPRAPCAPSRNSRAPDRPAQTPCFFHSWNDQPRAPASGRACESTMPRCRRRAPGSGRTPESPSRIAATARAPRRKTAARRTAAARVLAVAGLLAEGRRPGQGQQVEVELAGLVLARVLRGGLAPSSTQPNRTVNRKIPTHEERRIDASSLPVAPGESLLTRREHFKNICEHNMTHPQDAATPVGKFAFPNRPDPSGPRHPAGRVIGPVAIEADHAPLDPPADAEPALRSR